MTNAVQTAKAKATELMPTTKDMLEAGKLTGGIALGIIASHAAVKMVDKINTPVGHVVLLAGGFYGACVVKHPLLKAICAGAAVYGGLRLAAKGVAVVAAPGATEGLAGLIPDNVKTALAKYIPTFAGIDEVAGLGEADDEDFGNLSLDDQAAQFANIEEQAAAGVGDLRMVA